MNLQIPKKSTKLERGSSSSAPPPPSFPPWTELPEHLTADILQRLPTEEIIDSAQRVCTTWWRVCKNPATWRAIDLDHRRPTVCNCGKHLSFGDQMYWESPWQRHYPFFLFRRAVDLSQGQLLKLKINRRLGLG
ncbi:putative F-box/LRR-repeat protein 9 [Salvia splendens]|uniref:putative F-box/LRR-repeat protein 9 n=1 Tax=Salvia splendens TaxID=180675 RepID=UPI001C258D72|nr:putative F-box/LRR-repeat protein 9 [Salvia splendens]